MKTAKIIISFFVIILFLNGCSNKRTVDDKTLIIASIHPYELILRQLTEGMDINIKSLYPANASPHTYSPVPEDLISIEKAEIIFINGLELEMQFHKTLHQVDEKIYTLSDIFPANSLIRESESNSHDQSHNHNHSHSHDHKHDVNHEHCGNCGHQHGEYNPHIWTDPEYIVSIARFIAKTLIENNLVEEQKVLNNLRTLEAEIQIVDSKIRQARKNVTNPAIIYFHDAFAYFNRRYSIETAALIQPFPGREAGLAELAKLKSIINEFDVKSIVTEPQLNPKSAEIIAKEFNLKIITLDPIGHTLNVKTIAEWLDKTQTEIFKGLQ